MYNLSVSHSIGAFTSDLRKNSKKMSSSSDDSSYASSSCSSSSSSESDDDQDLCKTCTAPLGAKPVIVCARCEARRHSYCADPPPEGSAPKDYVCSECLGLQSPDSKDRRQLPTPSSRKRGRASLAAALGSPSKRPTTGAGSGAARDVGSEDDEIDESYVHLPGSSRRSTPSKSNKPTTAKTSPDRRESSSTIKALSRAFASPTKGSRPILHSSPSKSRSGGSSHFHNLFANDDDDDGDDGAARRFASPERSTGQARSPPSSAKQRSTPDRNRSDRRRRAERNFFHVDQEDSRLFVTLEKEEEDESKLNRSKILTEHQREKRTEQSANALEYL